MAQIIPFFSTVTRKVFIREKQAPLWRHTFNPDFGYL
jgi:hypothetical protein